MNLIAPESLVFWTTAIFIIFFFLLKKFAWKPILGAVKGREDSINKALMSAEEARREIQNLKADNERILHEARAEREDMLKDARDIRNKIISDAKEEAQKQSHNMIEAAKSAIESEKKSAMIELKNHVAELSLDIAEKVVRGELSNKDKQLELVDSLLGKSTLN
ncbi:F0F1 ATP synthase subunit B [uncultured Formosa sp.]|uniref:F0F1 ATP synthase subunit B n=1 Tax=uncultured Formosa sp. TaxID=255435 RepID=UPI00262B4307|nr:F0F1 ATP synthase subunit B [uncultured Formosa sp.]